VRGEVRHCDLVAMREGEPTVIVELKRSLSIPLLVQGMDRQKLTSRVYIAIELPAKGRAPQRLTWGEVQQLCKRLGLGLLTVRFYARKAPVVDVVCHPSQEIGSSAAASQAYAASTIGANEIMTSTSTAEMPDIAFGSYGITPQPAVPVRRNKRAAARLEAEFRGRSGDFNVGGSSRSKLLTVYRERALLIALALQERGSLTPREIRALTGNAQSAEFLQRNYYGWFDRVQRGLYALAPAGEAALEQYGDLVNRIAQMSGLRQQPQNFLEL
jgi:hypothetical protein